MNWLNRRWARSVLLGLGLACGHATRAQTLDQEYSFYLVNKCDNMNFERDIEQQLLPGQAGPNLFALCTGPLALPSGAPTSTIGVGGGSGVGGSRDTNQDGALRRRRDRQREESRVIAQADEGSIVSSATGLFTSLDFRNEKQDATRYEGGREADRFIATLGVDRRFGRALVGGAALRGESLAGEFASGGNFKSDGIGASLYASWYPVENLFVDVSGGLDARSLDTRRIVGLQVTTFFNTIPPTTSVGFNPRPRAVDGGTHTEDTSAELSAGYDFTIGAFSIGPRVGAAWRRSTIDAYAEYGNTPMSLAFDEQEETSMRSSAGLQAHTALSWSAGVAVPQLSLLWLHEYEDDQRVLTARFAEDLRPNPTRLRYLNEAPDRDTFSVRFSVAFAFKEGLNAFLSAERMFGHAYQDQTGVAMGVRWEL